MSLQYLKIFSYIEAIAGAGSIRKAAEQLFITPSALDRRVQILEQELGTPLFERHARGVRLTPAGELFVHHIRAQRADFERVKAEVEHLKGLRRGEVSIAASQALAFAVFPALMNRFHKLHPGISFTVQICDRGAVIDALRDFKADIGVVYNPPPSADMTTLMEVEQSLCVVMADDHPLARARTIRMRDCLGYPLALPDASLGSRALLEEYFARSSLEPRAVFESNSFEMLRNFVRFNDALTFQIQVGTRVGRSQDGVLARVVEERSLARRPLCIMQLKGRHLPLPAMRFLKLLRESLGGQRSAIELA